MSNKNTPYTILDRLMSLGAVVTNIYGKYSDLVIYDQEKEKAKRLLYHVYGYKNIWELLPPELDDQKTMDHVRTLMSIDIMQNPEATQIGEKMKQNSIL